MISRLSCIFFVLVLSSAQSASFVRYYWAGSPTCTPVSGPFRSEVVCDVNSECGRNFRIVLYNCSYDANNVPQLNTTTQVDCVNVTGRPCFGPSEYVYIGACIPMDSDESYLLVVDQSNVCGPTIQEVTLHGRAWEAGTYGLASGPGPNGADTSSTFLHPFLLGFLLQSYFC
jgi:hypothetical protein